MIKICMELEQPDYRQLTGMAEQMLQEHPEMGAKMGGLSPQMLKMAMAHLSDEQISQMLAQALNQGKERVIPSVEQGLRQAGAELRVVDFSMEAGETVQFTLIAEVESWFPLMAQLLPQLVPQEDLPERMGAQYQPGMTVADYLEELQKLPLYEQTLQFFSCCTAAKERMLAQTEQLLQSRSLPLRLKNMRFFVKR